MISYQAGDVVSNALTWSSSVRMGGLRVSRNFSVRPDLVTYPLLNLSGSAAVLQASTCLLTVIKPARRGLMAAPIR